MEIIRINGTKEINGKEIKVIEGGFGEEQKCMLASDIATQHNIELKELNRIINRNITRFNKNDILDFLSGLETLRNFAKENGLITSNRTKNIFLLSERGYTKLVAMMDNSNDKKWEVMDRLVDEYFAMREIINTNKQLKASLLLSIYNGGQEGVLASKQLTEIEVEEATKPLLQKIEDDKPLVGFAEKVIKSNDNILVRELAKIISDEVVKIGQNKLYELLRSWNYIMQKSTEPYQRCIDNGYFVVEEKTINTPYGPKLTKTTKITPRGQVAIVERLRREYEKAS